MVNQPKNQSFLRRFFQSRFFLFIIVILFGFVAIGYARAYYQDFKIRQEIDQLKKDISGLETTKLESFDILKYVSSQEFVEEKARTEFNLVKSGEKVLVMRADEGIEEVEESTVSEAVISNPRKWLYYFLHRPVDSQK